MLILINELDKSVYAKWKIFALVIYDVKGILLRTLGCVISKGAAGNK